MVAAAGIRLGADATANMNSASYGSPTWVPLPTMDVELGLTMEEADVTTRSSSKFKLTEPTLLGMDFTFDLLELPADTTFEALRTAFFARTVVDMLFSSIGAATASENRVRVECKIFGFKKAEPLAGVNKHSLVLKPCYSTNVPVTTVI